VIEERKEMAIEVTKFLVSLTAAIAAAADLEFAGTPREIWAGNAIEDACAEAYSVIRTYGAPSQAEFTRRPTISVQIDTRSKDDAAAVEQAWKIHESLLDGRQHPKANWRIAGKQIDADGNVVDDAGGDWVVRMITLLNGPGVVGKDEAGRAFAPFNIEVQFVRVEKAN
jgi:hypothetical protein